MASQNIGTARLMSASISATLLNPGGSSAAVTGLVYSANLTKSFAFSLEETNMAGVRETAVYDDRTISGSLGIRMNASSPTFPKQGGIITCSGFTDTDLNVEYFVESVAETIQRGSFVDVTVNVKYSEGIDLTP